MNTKEKILRILFLILLLPEFLLFAAGWYFSSQIIQFSKKTLEEDRIDRKIQSVSDFGLPAPQEIRFLSDGIQIAGWLFLNPNSQKKCGVVLAHGHSGTRYGALRFTPLFWKRGCDLLVYDHRYHGESKGEFGTYGYYEKLDMLEAVKFFREKTGLSEKQIGLMGVSYGASTALMAASLNDNLAFIAADAPYSDFVNIIKERTYVLYGNKLDFLFPFALYIASVRASFSPEDVSPKVSASNIRIPVFLSHSIEDEYTSINHSKEIFQNIRFPKKVFHATNWGAAHGKSIDTNFEKYDEQMDEFLNTYTKGFELIPPKD